MNRKQTPRPVARRAPTPQVPTGATEPAEAPTPAPDAHPDPSPTAEAVSGDPVALSIGDDDGETDAPAPVTNGVWPLVWARCPSPECSNPGTVVRMADDWQHEVTEHHANIPIVGCGSPWHYATASLGDPAPATAPAPARQERTVTAREAGYTAEQEARAGIIEGGPGSTMYVVRISGGALARLLGLAGIRECSAAVETA